MSSTTTIDRSIITTDLYLESIFGGFCGKTLPELATMLCAVFVPLLNHVRAVLESVKADREARRLLDERRRVMLAYRPPHTTGPMPTACDSRDVVFTPLNYATDITLASHDSVMESIMVGCGVYDDGTGNSNEGNPPLPLLGVPAVNDVKPITTKGRNVKRGKADRKVGKRQKGKQKATKVMKHVRDISPALMTYHELRAACKQKGIPATGTAAAMRERLEQHDRAAQVA